MKVYSNSELDKFVDNSNLFSGKFRCAVLILKIPMRKRIKNVAWDSLLSGSRRNLRSEGRNVKADVVTLPISVIRNHENAALILDCHKLAVQRESIIIPLVLKQCFIKLLINPMYENWNLFSYLEGLFNHGRPIQAIAIHILLLLRQPQKSGNLRVIHKN
jgi:hypothetical protein